MLYFVVDNCRHLRNLIGMIGLLATPWPMAAQGVIHIDTVPAPSLRGNLLGDTGRRAVSIYLPPSYRARPERRYPVIYLLHGYGATHRAFIRGAYQNLNIRISMDSLVRVGAVREMIVVTPDANSSLGGSFYANSPVTGQWEDFIVRDLVQFVDRKYRTIRGRNARGIAGHSMGGYGAIHIAMRNPDTFSALYALSPCCLSYDIAAPPIADRPWRAAIVARDRAEYLRAGFHANLLTSLGAVLSPDTSVSPFFVKYPFRLDGGRLVVDSLVAARWKLGPISQAQAHSAQLRQIRIAIDAGSTDALRDIPINVRRLQVLLDSLGVSHTSEIYEGGHGNRIRNRIEAKVLPFFSRALQGGQH